ncbi:hypothetical protein FNV43_RR08227 [Rhamnella rubrinervis]|uniref:Uncharacterized protein n=1 Tax=Rhamnella rubrinervis TaxID=2594499 RepID=A0A8K0HI30_9ROSA|nr:hypothetical protein FNV43_RR08227 [Rhamnella rubrinervis]
MTRSRLSSSKWIAYRIQTAAGSCCLVAAKWSVIQGIELDAVAFGFVTSRYRSAEVGDRSQVHPAAAGFRNSWSSWARGFGLLVGDRLGLKLVDLSRVTETPSILIGEARDVLNLWTVLSDSFVVILGNTAGANEAASMDIPKKMSGAAYTIPTTSQNVPTRKDNFGHFIRVLIDVDLAVHSDIRVVHRSGTITVSNDTFDDLDDELPIQECGVLQDPSGMQVQEQDGSTFGGQINIDTTMEFRFAVLPIMWIFAYRSLENARILLNEEQIIYVDISRVRVLKNYAASIDHSWTIIGDFNVILGAHERSSGGPPIHSSCTDFQVAVEVAGLLPIDTHRAFFTWGRCGTHGQVALSSSFC